MSRLASLLLVVSFLPSQTRAEAPSTDSVTDTKLALSVPQSPAFQALGISPEEVVQPTSPTAFTTALLAGLDPRGTFQAGLALDSSPFLLFFGDDLELTDYRQSTLQRLLARTQMSLATAKAASGDDPAVRIGLGFRLSPWDQGDPRLDELLTTCFGTLRNDADVKRLQLAFVDEVSDAAIAGDEAKAEALEKKLEEQTNAIYASAGAGCRKESASRNWNAGSWTLGLAPTWISKTGSLSDLGNDGFSAWSSVAYGFKGGELFGKKSDAIKILEKKSQLLLSLRYRDDEKVPVEGANGIFIEQDSLIVGFQLKLAAYQPDSRAAPTLILSAEGDYLYKNPAIGKSDSSYRISIGGDVRIPGTENTYVKLTAGGSSGNSDGSNSGFALTSLSFGF